MRRALAVAALGGIVAGGGAMLAARGQDRPGVVGQPTVVIAPASVVQARLARQQWEYRTLTLQPGQDPSAALSGPGADEREVAGVLPGNASGTPVLKRPR